MDADAVTAPLYDSVVIGGGPAGLTAALQLARFNRRVMLMDAGGGRASYHQVNHNYLGFPGRLKACELLELGRKQVREYPVAFCDGRVVACSRGEGIFHAQTERGAEFRGRTIVFATGVRDDFPSSRSGSATSAARSSGASPVTDTPRVGNASSSRGTMATLA